MNLLITGAWRNAKENIDILKKMGHNVIFLQYEKDNLPCEYDWVEGVICNGLFLSHSINKFSNLKYVQLTSVGYDRIDMEYIKKNNIMIFNAKDVYAIPIAEYVICGVLQLYKQTSFFYKNKNERKWLKHRNLLELTNKTVLIIGCGNIGDECAKRFNAFGCEIIGIDLIEQEKQNYNKIYSISEVDNFINKSDIIILTIPFTKETNNFMNEYKIKSMKNNAILVNVSRGEVLDYQSLLNEINRLGGAVLDVFDEEPLPDNSCLWDCDNVVITPHNSFQGEYNQDRLKKLILNNIRG